MIRNEKGITLVEVLAAVVILSILVVAFTNISTFTTKSSSTTDRRAGALRVAEERLNTIRNNIGTTALPIMGSQDVVAGTDASGFYQIDVSDTSLQSPSYSAAGLTHKVYLQDIYIMRDLTTNPETRVSRLIIVTVSWEG